MKHSASGVGAGERTAILVMNSGSSTLLCPFFDKCDGVLIHNASNGSQLFHPRDRFAAKSMCELLIELQPDRIICGFMGEPDVKRLRDTGIDVRLGPCSCSIDELVASFSILPPA